MLAMFQVLMYNMMTIVNTKIYLKVVDRVDPKSFHYKRKRLFSFFVVVCFLFLYLYEMMDVTKLTGVTISQYIP